jgi:hypothetical protein
MKGKEKGEILRFAQNDRKNAQHDRKSVQNDRKNALDDKGEEKLRKDDSK